MDIKELQKFYYQDDSFKKLSGYQREYISH